MGDNYTVQSTRVKDGKTDDDRAWVNTLIDTVEGKKFTTFETSAQYLGPGDVIDVTESERGTGNKRDKILKYKKVEGGQTSAPGASQSYNGGDSPEKRKSIEDQTRAERITELWIAGKIEAKDLLVSKLRTWLEKLENTAPEPAENSIKKPEPSSSTEEAIKSGHFENLGQFLAACYQERNFNRTDVMTYLSVGKPEEIRDLDAAFKEIMKLPTKNAE